jgi:hypothetical protein
MRLCGWSALALVFAMLATASAAQTGARLALIGNEAYANEIGRLSC